MPRAPACPYYGRVKGEQIVCLRDGAGTKGGELLMNFPSQVCRLRYWMQYCCGDWEACSLAPALALEYETHEARKDDKPAAPKTYNKWLTAPGLRKIESYARKGLEDEQIAEKCGRTIVTFRKWKKQYPEFAEALKRGRQSQ